MGHIRRDAASGSYRYHRLIDGGDPEEAYEDGDLENLLRRVGRRPQGLAKSSKGGHRRPIRPFPGARFQLRLVRRLLF
jgi:hypothetical protein